MDTNYKSIPIKVRYSIINKGGQICRTSKRYASDSIPFYLFIFLAE